MTDRTQDILCDLWKHYSTETLPAEWDGHVYGGGKLSQRFWEYFKTVEYGQFNESAVVLDIGGSGKGVDREKWHGAGFLARLLAPHVRWVHVADPACTDGTYRNVTCIGAPAFEDSPKWDRAQEHLETVTHITCVSVLEHIEHAERLRMLGDLHDFAACMGVQTIVLTCEYHPTHIFWPHILTTRQLSECLALFTGFYPDRYEASPTRCVNAVAPNGVPLWYPVAVRLRRMT